jgi:hypothetical protein
MTRTLADQFAVTLAWAGVKRVYGMEFTRFSRTGLGRDRRPRLTVQSKHSDTCAVAVNKAVEIINQYQRPRVEARRSRSDH